MQNYQERYKKKIYLFFLISAECSVYSLRKQGKKCIFTRTLNPLTFSEVTEGVPTISLATVLTKWTRVVPQMVWGENISAPYYFDRNHF